MGASNSSGQNTQFYKLKIDKETDIPAFYRKEKKGDLWVESETFNTMSGRFRSIEVKNYIYEGEEKQSMKITLDDNASDDRIVIEASFNYATRSMLNSLAGCSVIGNVEFKCAKWGKGEKKYPTIFVTVDGQKTAWAYAMESLPKVEEIQDKRGRVVKRDDSEVNAFFVSVAIPEINKKIMDENLVKSEMKQDSKAYVKRETESFMGDTGDEQKDNELIDDLPF